MHPHDIEKVTENRGESFQSSYGETEFAIWSRTRNAMSADVVGVIGVGNRDRLARRLSLYRSGGFFFLGPDELHEIVMGLAE